MDPSIQQEATLTLTKLDFETIPSLTPLPLEFLIKFTLKDACRSALQEATLVFDVDNPHRWTLVRAALDSIGVSSQLHDNLVESMEPTVSEIEDYVNVAFSPVRIPWLHYTRVLMDVLIEQSYSERHLHDYFLALEAMVAEFPPSRDDDNDDVVVVDDDDVDVVEEADYDHDEVVFDLFNGDVIDEDNYYYFPGIEVDDDHEDDNAQYERDEQHETALAWRDLEELMDVDEARNEEFVEYEIVDHDFGDELNDEQCKEVVQRLERVVDKEVLGGEECGICLNEFSTENRGVLKLPCNHMFHENCIGDWFKKNLTCPFCRSIVSANK